ncbi:MAG: arylesterase [Proteobacteria bacterium]|nr:arylesterase [Pseudomonadota bacterium]
MACIPYQKSCLAVIITLSLLLVNATQARAVQKTILAFGDSLTAGYGIPRERAFPAQLEQELQKQSYSITVINAGVSGDTTSGGLTRLEWALAQHPNFVILELGANDMLRGIDPAITRANLRKMLKILQKQKIPVLLAGMKATPNLGPAFLTSYQKMYQTLAKEYDAVYYPFFLEGTALQTNLIQDDGLHPNAAGVAVIVQHILPSVKKLLEKK